MNYALAVDVGGTFVDLTLCELTTGKRWVRKVLSDQGPIAAFLNGVRLVCSDAEIAFGQIERVVHGLTLATNALLERSEAGAAVVITEGFRDVLEIGRHSAVRTDLARWLKPRRPVGRDRVVEVLERVTWEGEVLTPLTQDACNRVIARLKDLRVTSVAIGLLHAYAYPDHERRLAEQIRAAIPGIKISVSHDVLPQAGEYERIMATLINAYVKPTMDEYLRKLSVELGGIGLNAPLYIMSSDGGVLAWQDAAELPIATALSGPAGGASAAAEHAAQLGEFKIVALDVGGTSSDVTCADGGNVDVTVDGQIGDFPISLPILDVHTIGAGGGSIASIERDRFLVGPASAGARPGPACYGGGGTRPTVTDALLALGWLPDRLAGGALQISRDAARKAIEVHIAEPMKTDVTTAAAGIVRMANTHMANAIRHVSTERGRDVREYTLVAFGGAGGLHAVEVAQLAGIPRVLVPPSPGVFTTEGLLAADLRRYYVRSFPRAVRLDGLDIATLESSFESMEAEARQWLDSGAPTEARSIERLLDLRYVNQGSELLVTLDSGPLSDESLQKAIDRFHQAYRIRYRYNLAKSPVEVVRARVLANGRLPYALPEKTQNIHREQVTRSRQVYFDRHGWVDCDVVAREQIGSGWRVEGPTVVEGYDSTLVLPPRTTASIADNGSIIVACEEVLKEQAA